LDEFTFLHKRKLIPSAHSNRGYPLTFLSLGRKSLFEFAKCP